MIRVGLFLIVFGVFFSCVPAKKFAEIETANKKLTAQQTMNDSIIAHLRKDNSRYISTNVALQRDTLRLHYAYEKLSKSYRDITQTGSLELAQAHRLLDDKNVESIKREEQAKAVNYALKTIDLEVNTLYRTLISKLQRYQQYGVLVESAFWRVTVSVPDDLLFSSDDHSRLSSRGETIVSAILAAAAENSRFELGIREIAAPGTIKVTRDSIVTIHTRETVPYMVQAIDTLALIGTAPVLLERDVVKYEIVKKEGFEESPARLVKGSPVLKYIESNKRLLNQLTYYGVAVTGRSAEGGGRGDAVEFVIQPKLSGVLKTIGNIRF